MAVLQSSYTDTPAIGLPGQVVNMEVATIISRTLAVGAANVPFGQPVMRGASDHLAVLMAALTLQAAGAAVAGNTGNGVIPAAPVVSAGAKVGRYKGTFIAAATNAGTFELEDPEGRVVDTGTVAVAFAKGGLAFTIPDGATDWAVGDQFTIDVSVTATNPLGEYLGISVRDTALAAEIDTYRPPSQGSPANAGQMAILNRGVIWGTAGATVKQGDPVYWNSGTQRYTNTLTDTAIPRAVFDTGAVNGGMVRIRQR